MLQEKRKKDGLWRLAPVFALVLTISACGGTVTPPPPSPVAVAPTATAAPSAAPSASHVLTASQKAAAHITESVTRLLSIDDPTRIEAWIAVENKWLDSVSSLPIVRPYVIEFLDVLRQQAFEADTINYSVIALNIIKAARQVPGVDLP